jgi:hypothetical protein
MRRLEASGWCLGGSSAKDTARGVDLPEEAGELQDEDDLRADRRIVGAGEDEELGMYRGEGEITINGWIVSCSIG